MVLILMLPINLMLDSGESGTDVFTFTVSDGTTTTSSTITFTVNGANDAPTVVNDTDSLQKVEPL